MAKQSGISKFGTRAIDGKSVTSEARHDRPPTIGVLALQGDFEAHERLLAGLGARCVEVRMPRDLVGLDGLVVPGGESTTMLLGLDDSGLEQPLVDFARAGKPMLATCAGAILLAKEVLNPKQRSLGLVDATVERNAYGRQVDSFIAKTPCPALGGGELEVVFIRAPILRRIGPSVKALVEQGGLPVLIQDGEQFLVATFHPELTDDPRIHARFLELVENHRAAKSS
jgi:5'-phosphate synthase pdxT subunit